MIRTAGSTFDLYDDSGSLLKEKLGGKVPDCIREAHLLDSESRDALPDNAFALVLVNGQEQLRKYACVDKGNTVANVIYFLENKNKLPKLAQEVAARNLTRACIHHDLTPPADLEKVAGKNKVLIKGDGSEMTVNKGETKLADLSGTSLMPNYPDPHPQLPAKKKLASIIEDPYVDVTGGYLLPELQQSQHGDDMYALVGDDGMRSIPLVTYQQVKEAADFFSEQAGRLAPRTRRAFCTKLASRAGDLGVSLTDEILKYGSNGYARSGELDLAVQQRKQLWKDRNESAIEMLDSLMEKRASVDPDTFAESLAQLDIAADSDRFWDSAIWDPWFSTFGKEAQESYWRWQQGGDYLTEDSLKRFTSEGVPLLTSRFGESIALGLSKDPVSVFESMPLEQKRIIARMASQHESDL